VLVGTLVASLAVSSWRAGRMRTWTLSRLHPALSI
jgi:putative membrane protein